MRAELLARTGPVTGLTHVVRDLSRIGRGKANDVDLPLPDVARLHATVSFSGGTYWVEDAGSPQGTFVNGRRVAKERLRHLDVLTVGSADLVFVLREGSSADDRPVTTIRTARLVAVDGPEGGQTREIPRGAMTVGRVTACNLVLDSAAVSKMHARLENTGQQILLFDLGSSNGTFVNGVRLGSATLADGDRVVFGAVREFRLEIVYGEGSAAIASSGSASGFLRTMGSDASKQIAGDPASNWRIRYDFTPGEVAEDAMAETSHRPRTLKVPAAPSQEVPSVPRAPATRPAAASTVDETVKAKSAEIRQPEPAPAVPKKTVPAALAASRTLSAVALTGETKTFRLGRGSHIVGRLPTCPIAIDAPRVSRHHATLVVSPEGATVVDNASVNGTFLNGERLTGPAGPRPLADGDTVTFAEAAFRVGLTFE